MTPPPPEPLLDLVRGRGRHLWIGTRPPFDFDAVALYACSNYRAAAGLHQAYDVVWCYEDPITTLRPDQIPLLMDELIRFVGCRGLLVLRYDFLSGVLAVKYALGRRPGLTARVVHEELVNGDTFTSVIEIERADIDRYKPAPWTFGVLTQNTRLPNVVAFLKSIRDHDPKGEHEIIVCGPEHPAYAFADPVYLPQVYSPRYAEICRKKNDIAKAATRPNLLIAHDRYKLDNNFFTGFAEYGYDFDFVSPAQQFEDGEEFPALCHLYDDRFAMTPPSMATDLNSVRRRPYLNGGLFAIKTHLLRAVPLNELCFWNQAEDVEHAVMLLRLGVAPRLNPYSSATTLGTPKSHIKCFVPADPPPPPPEPDPVPPLPPAPVRRSLARRAVGKAKRLVLRRLKLVLAAVLLLMLVMQAAILAVLVVRVAP